MSGARRPTRALGDERVARWLVADLRPRHARRRAPSQPTPTPPPAVTRIAHPAEPQAVEARSARSGRARASARRSAAQLFVVLPLAALVVALVLKTLAGEPVALREGWRGLGRYGSLLAAALVAPPTNDRLLPAVVAGPAEERADAHIKRQGHGSIHGGILFVPETFASADGAYDLLLHFHGNTGVVRESAEHAGLDAIVAVVNLGVGSAPYEDTYAVPGTYEALLAEIQRVVGERGLKGPHLRRVALSSWSAGYGAISSLLQVRKGTDPLDAILVLDGIHCGWLDESRTTLNHRQLAPWVAVARSAADDRLLFSITHTEIVPPDYASAQDTASFLLAAVGARREPADPALAPIHAELKAAEGAVSKRLEKRLEPLTEARLGSLHVRGFRGNTPEHHMAHLLQMTTTVVPELAERWR